MTSLDSFWLKDKSVAALDSQPTPDELASEIIEISRRTEQFQRNSESVGMTYRSGANADNFLH